MDEQIFGIRDLVQDLNPRLHLRLAEAHAQAIGYVWGRQDQGLPGDTADALTFGRIYAEHVHAYMTEKRFNQLNIRDAFESFSRDGVIERS
jgi:hypothetical protein